MVVYGSIDYEDIFDDWHRTDFCFDYRGYLMKPDNSGIEKLIWSACPKHNCYDKDCPQTYGDVGCPQRGEMYVPAKPPP